MIILYKILTYYYYDEVNLNVSVRTNLLRRRQLQNLTKKKQLKCITMCRNCGCLNA